MKKIGLLSDTHSFFDERIYKFFDECDELWHAGDFGSMEVVEKLEEFKPTRGVYGNIDDAEIRLRFPLHDRFDCEGMDVWMTHIGGYPPKYNRQTVKQIQSNPPALFICGHSHILRVKPDKKLGLLHLNPGACGNEGIHKIKTMMMLEIEDGKLKRLQAVDLGPRGMRPTV